MFKKKLNDESPIQESPNKSIVENGLGLQQNLFRIPDIILKKRNGHELTKDEINFFGGGSFFIKFCQNIFQLKLFCCCCCSVFIAELLKNVTSDPIMQELLLKRKSRTMK